MTLFGIDSSQQGTPLFRMAGTGQQTRATAEPATQTVEESTVASSGTSIMAGHFVHAFRQESEYITGLKAGLSAQNNLMTKMQSVITGTRNVMDLTANAMALQGKEMTYAQQVLLGEKAADDVKTIVEDEVADTNGEKIEELREDIEEKAKEAVASESQEKLENETSPQEELEDSLDETAPEAQAEAEGQEAVTEPEPNAEPVAAAPETDRTEAAAPTDETGQGTAAPQEAPGEAPATPSIDIIV